MTETTLLIATRPNGYSSINHPDVTGGSQWAAEFQRLGGQTCTVYRPSGHPEGVNLGYERLRFVGTDEALRFVRESVTEVGAADNGDPMDALISAFGR